MAPQWARRNVFQAMGRRPAGSIPFSASARLIGFQPTSCSRFLSAPRIRVVSATRILESHSNEETLNFVPDSRSPRRSVALTPVEFLGNQLAVPPEKRIRRDEGGDLSKPSAAEAFRFPRESASSGVGKSKVLPAERLAENAVLLLQVLDHFPLVAARPSGKQNESELQRQRYHRESLAPSGRAEIGRNRS